jgi:hypothetical protein
MLDGYIKSRSAQELTICEAGSTHDFNLFNRITDVSTVEAADRSVHRIRHSGLESTLSVLETVLGMELVTRRSILIPSSI